MRQEQFDTIIVVVLGVVAAFFLMMFCFSQNKVIDLHKELKNLQKQAVELGYATNIVEYIGDIPNVRWQWNSK